MKLITTLLSLFAFLIISCSDSKHDKAESKSQEYPEGYVADSSGITKDDSTMLHTGWYYVADAESGYPRLLDKSTDTFFIDPKPIVTAKNFTTFEIFDSDAGGRKYIGLSMPLDDEGTEKWAIATEKAIGKKLAFILDNQLLQAAKVNDQITNGMTVLSHRNYSRAELKKIKAIIESEK